MRLAVASQMETLSWFTDCSLTTHHRYRCALCDAQAHHPTGHHAGLTELPHAAADEEPVAVFDMRSGAKTRVLHFGCVTFRHEFDGCY